MFKKLEEKFRLHCNARNLELNPNQIFVIKKLENYYKDNFRSSIFSFFSKQVSKKSFYLCGDVGVGKTMVLDFFFNLLDQKKQRLHFNEFMLNFHNFVHENKNNNEENVVSIFVKDLKSKFSLIFLDEFQVTNIVDAMILGKLFQEIFSQNIKVIVTSNTKISELYKDGLQRDQFKPFINIMLEKSIEHELIIDDDYRKTKENQKQRYFYPLNQETNFKLNKFFRTITKDKRFQTKSIIIKGRKFEFKNFFDGVSRFNFSDLCDQNLAGEDYLEITKICEFMVIEKIPQFNNINVNQQLRFITLIDIIYDRYIPIAITVDHSLDKFTSSKSLQKEFKRTISRLYELTSMDYN